MRPHLAFVGFAASLLALSCGPAPEVAWPISGDDALDADAINSPFGPRDQGGKYDFHAGVDFPVPEGTKVRAIKAGVVEKLEDDDGGTGPGNWVLIDHGDGEKSSYLHLSKFRTKAGDAVEAGEVIGLSGTTGTSSPHLHLTYMVGVEGNGADESMARNPLELLPHTEMPAPPPTNIVLDATDGSLTAFVDLVAMPMIVQRIVVEGDGVARVVDYADILALGNPARDEQLQSGVWLSVTKVEEGRFTLGLRGDGFDITKVELYDYAGERIQ